MQEETKIDMSEKQLMLRVGCQRKQWIKPDKQEYRVAVQGNIPHKLLIKISNHKIREPFSECMLLLTKAVLLYNPLKERLRVGYQNTDISKRQSFSEFKSDNTASKRMFGQICLGLVLQSDDVYHSSLSLCSSLSP
ncbi:hypothetical protein Tco_0898547 [Tanacetum coccineum]